LFIMTPRVLQVVAEMSCDAGVALPMLRHYRYLDRSRLQFDFVSHGPPDDFHKEVRALGGRVFCIKTAGKAGLGAYVRTLRGLMREHGPYVAVHAHTNYQAGIVGLAAWLEKVPTRICHIRGVHIDERNRRLLPLYRFLIRLTCNVHLACSRQAGCHYYGRRPFTVIANAVDLREFGRLESNPKLLRRQLGIDGYGMVLGHVGRFSVEKNHAFLLEVLRDLRAIGNNACLVLAGDGPLRADVAARATRLGLHQHVRFLGARKDIPDLMHTFDVLLLPSFSEGMPNVVIEAQAMGLACLVSDTITHEVDLGLGLVSHASIAAPGPWVERLPAVCRTPHLDAFQIREAIVHAGFEIEQNVAALTALYTETFEH
jgi:glycosyltransferase EpsF